MIRRVQFFACTFVFLLLLAPAAFAQTGNVEGTVSDAETGAPLPGVNIVILEDGETTTMGATTNADGYFNILNVSPGTYSIRASFVGYTTQRVEGINVNIDLTTEVEFELQPATEELDEVVVQAQEEIVKRDVSANVANLSSEMVENVPTTSLQGLIGLQAGAQGLSIRGSNPDELSLRMDGASMRGGRNNEPIMAVSYASIDEVQIQTGGFNAEYGNVRSGLVNVVTKEGPRNRYTADLILKYSSPGRDYFGPLPNDRNSHWMRPYTHPRIAYEGVFAGCEDLTTDKGCVWDKYTREQYVNPEFRGFNQLSKELLKDSDPGNDMTPDELRDVYLYFSSRDMTVDIPDYTIDGAFGGPVPGISNALGDLRFFASYRQDNTAYPIPMMPAERKLDRSGRLKLTSDIGRGMKLQMNGLLARDTGLNISRHGYGNVWNGGASYLDNIGSSVFEGVDGGYLRKEIDRYMLGGVFTHTLSPNTFYKVRAQKLSESYLNVLPEFADTTVVGYWGTLERFEDEIGKLLPGRRFTRMDPASEGGSTALGAHNAETRDSTQTATWTVNFDLTHQLNRHVQFKTGLDYVYEDLNVRHGIWEADNTPFGDDAWHWYQEHTYEFYRRLHQGAAYAQAKISFQRLIANIGLRGDYFDPATDWYVHDPFTNAFSNVNGNQFEELVEHERMPAQFRLSPRLGVSFPVSVYSKLFFNYGYFRQLLTPRDLYQVRRWELGAIRRLGNPNHPMPTTVSYELGYEHNLFNLFLIRLTGYYKAKENQPRDVEFENIDGTVVYDKPYPLNYGDTRGVEVSLNKISGRWVRGFANFTYMSDKSGNFGYGQQYENRTLQREYEQTALQEINTPTPRPWANINLELMTPRDFGPRLGDMQPLADWRITVLTGWRAGDTFTWDGAGTSGQETEVLENNISWKDDWDFDMRISKAIQFPMMEVQFFTDISNVLNRRELNQGAFSGRGFLHYMTSLHLPKETFEQVEGEPYNFVYGDDKPGDFREYAVEYTPIQVTGVAEDGRPDISTRNLHPRPLYYARPEGADEGTYYEWTGNEWKKADADKVEYVLDNKAYIRMPHESTWTFLNPRRINFGIRVTF
jgi:hypothetical protein